MIKKILFIIPFISLSLFASNMSATVEENGLYKPLRIKKSIPKNIQNNDRNIISKRKFIEVSKKEKKYEKDLIKIKEDKKIENKKEDLNNTNENKIVKVKEVKRKFKDLLYIKQETPMQKMARFYNKDKNSLYRDSLLYLINDKQIGSLEDINKILNSRDDYLSFYEAIVKTFYQGYFEAKYNKYLLRQMILIYEKSYDKIQDTYVGLLLQDLFLSMGIIHPKAPLISSISYCYLLADKISQISCKINQVEIMCLSGQDEKCNIYKAKLKFKYKEADIYLNGDLELVSDVNLRKEKEFYIKEEERLKQQR